MQAVGLRGVEKSFDGTLACSGIDLDIREGEFFTFLGPSGCGKTTILRLIAGFITPEAGSIHLGSRDITHLPPEKREVGMVFQNYSLFPFLTVYQNIEYGLAVQKRSARETRAIVERQMEMIGLKGYGDRKISELSGGEQQRVALARSLAVEPKVLLMDEPLSNLDARLRDKMRGEIKSLQKTLGITTIFVTHDQTEALTLSDRIAVFNKGRIVQVGTPAELYARPQNIFVAGFLGDANIFEVTVQDGWATVATDFRVKLNAEAAEGSHLFVRPQDVVLSKTSSGSENVFPGILMDRQLNGVWIDSTVRIQGTDFHVASLNTAGNEVLMHSGDEVYLSLPPQSLSLLDE